MKTLNEDDINARLTPNDALFNNIYIIQQDFNIIPHKNGHYGACIDYQDISELRNEFLAELYNSIVDWVYSSDKYRELKEAAMSMGRSEAAASAEVQKKAHEKFRANHNVKEILMQGQFGELILFHFIQRCQKAVPLVRKMKLTTSANHERFGADAIHFKYENGKPLIILGEAKTYTSEYRFNVAFENAVNSILTTYENHKKELKSYVHEDFLDKEMNAIAEAYLNNKLEDVEVHLVCVVVYNETNNLNITNKADIRNQIEEIIRKRYDNFDNTKIDIEHNAILNRITYIVFPVWKLEELVREFQNKL